MFKIPTRVLSRELDGELFLVNIDTGYYFGLNEVGTRMWQALARHGSVEVAVAELRKEYRVDADRLRADLADLAGKLLEHGLLEDISEPSDASSARGS